MLRASLTQSGPIDRAVLSPVRVLRALLLPADAAFDVLRIAALGTAFALFLLYVGNFLVERGVHDYEMWADAIVSGKSLAGHQSLAWRDIGYALILLMGGFPWTQSFVGVTIIGACMGIAMPIMAYFTLRPWFPRAAYWTALASIVSLAPFIMFKVLHHDQPYNFFLVAVAWSLSRYRVTGRPPALYAFTFFAFAMTLMRLLGQAMYPVLALVSYLQSRKNLGHFLAGAALFALATVAYSHYRADVLGLAPSAPGQQVLGKQMFYNLYLNAADFHVTISPELGPNTRRLVDALRGRFLPSPAESDVVLGFDQTKNPGGTTPEFLREHFLRFDADQLTEEFLTHPNLEYYFFIVAYLDDSLLLSASLEIASHHPLYVAAYTLRNALRLLYDPGHSQTRYRVHPHYREGLHFVFSAGLGDSANIGEETPEPALTEAAFLPVIRQPGRIREIFFFLDERWRHLYRPVTVVLFCLMMVTWLSTAIGLSAKLVRAPWLNGWSTIWLSERVLAASTTLSMLLLLNVGITGLLVDPLYRYDHSILMLKIMLAGIGGAVLIRLMKSVGAALYARPRHGSAATQRADEITAIGAGRPATAARGVRRPIIAIASALLGLVLIGGFAAWAWYMRTVVVGGPADGTVHVTGATFGAICPAERDNELQHVRSACSGKKRCFYVYDARVYYLPAPGCVTDVRIQWTCSDGGQTFSRVWTALPDKTPLEISCP